MIFVIFYFPQMQKGQSVKKMMMVLILLTLILREVSTCPSHSSSNNGYCSCNPGYIFNCNWTATNEPSNSYLSLIVGVPSFFILNAPINQPLNYNINLVSSDKSISIQNIFDFALYVDEGATTLIVNCEPSRSSPEINTLNLQSSFQLGNQPGTQNPQQLILAVNQTIPSNASLFLNYNYSTISTTNIFLILGYVAGGLLVAIAVFFIILLYRKKRREEGERSDQSNMEKKQINISHFNELMPAAVISVNIKKEMQICSVCLQEFDFASIIRKTICGHVFHQECLDEWCLKNLSCPMCRTDLSHVNILKLRIQNAKNNETTDWVMNTIDQEQAAESPIREPLVRGQEQMDHFIQNNIGNGSL